MSLLQVEAIGRRPQHLGGVYRADRVEAVVPWLGKSPALPVEVEAFFFLRVVCPFR